MFKYLKFLFFLILILSFVLSYLPQGLTATEEEIQALKQQVRELLKRIEKLEAEQAKAKEEAIKAEEEITKIKETTAKVSAERIDLANALSKLKIKGRAAIGFFDSGKAGSYPSGSFEMPDAKIQFSFEPDETNTVVMRFNLNNATAQSPLLDYFYLHSKDFLSFIKDTPFSLSCRLGRFKLGFGEETWTDNPVEGVLPSKSAAGVSVIDEGLELAGKIKLDKIHLKPFGWVLSVSNGNKGVGSDTSGAKSFMGKLYYTPIDPLYLSASYYNSGSLKTSNTEMSIAGLVSPPTGVTKWDRTVWEFDVRYDFGKGKKPLEPIVYSDSKAIIRLSYGQFADDVSSAPERNGQFGFVDGTYNLTKKFYTAARYSLIDLDGDQTASLNGITANRYQRYSLGLGYRLSENTILKLSYDWNKESASTLEDADNDLLSAIVASQF